MSYNCVMFCCYRVFIQFNVLPYHQVYVCSFVSNEYHFSPMTPNQPFLALLRMIFEKKCTTKILYCHLYIFSTTKYPAVQAEACGTGVLLITINKPSLQLESLMHYKLLWIYLIFQNINFRAMGQGYVGSKNAARNMNVEIITFLSSVRCLVSLAVKVNEIIYLFPVHYRTSFYYFTIQCKHCGQLLQTINSNIFRKSGAGS